MGLTLSYAVCTYEARYWAWPPPRQLERRVHLAPTIAPQNLSAPREKMRILILSSDLPYDLVLLGQIAATRVYLLVTHP